jgi:hypothetical protein
LAAGDCDEPNLHRCSPGQGAYTDRGAASDTILAEFIAEIGRSKVGESSMRRKSVHRRNEHGEIEHSDNHLAIIDQLSCRCKRIGRR